MANDYYALLLETIDAMEESPADVRRAIYEVARHQLEKQLMAAKPQASPTQMRNEQNALDQAIRRIDAEAAAADPPRKKPPPPPLTVTPPQPAALQTAEPSTKKAAPPAPKPDLSDGEPLALAKPEAIASLEPPLFSARTPPPHIEPIPRRTQKWRPGRQVRGRKIVWALKVLSAALVGGLAAGAGGFALMQAKSGSAVYQFPDLSSLLVPARTATPAATPAPAASKSAAPPATRPAAAAASSESANIPVPDVYGVYALHNGKLVELRGTPLGAPDRRPGMGTIFKDASRTAFTQGRLHFIVFRRSLLTNAPERVLVSVVARVAQETITNAAGQVTTSPVSNQWLLRGVGQEFRVAPIKGQPEMILIRPEAPDLLLPPGRYALMVADQAFEFQIDGIVIDPAHCVERTNAVSAIVYSECAAAGPRAARGSTF